MLTPNMPAVPKVVRLDTLFGWVRLTQGQPRYGEQFPHGTYEAFDRHGVCIERRTFPPAIRIEY